MTSAASEVLGAGLMRSACKLVENDPGVRLGEDEEAVHQARVATRRLRSDLRTFETLLDASWATPLREELRWLGDALGEVRDADVLLIRLRRQLDGLRRPDRVVGARLLDLVGAQRDEARQRLMEVYESTRYGEVLEAVVEGAAAPRLLPGADAPASEVLPALAAAAWDALETSMRRIGPGSADDELHAARIRAKRARYATEVAAPVVGKRAEKLAGRIAGVQEVLGNHQDACAARDWLRGVALDLEAPVAFVAGELAGVQDVEALACRRDLAPAWERASKSKLRAWLRR
jgi:CHAD domain-containing protein